MEKITRLPSMTHLSDLEYEAFALVEQREYSRRLKMICPSKELRLQAKEIADDDYGNPCEKCVYGDKHNNEACRIPHTDAYMETLDIDPCYEGVLLFLSKEMERNQKEKDLKIDEADALLDNIPEILHSYLEVINSLTSTIIDVVDNNETFTPFALQLIRSMNDKTKKMLDNWDTDDEDEPHFEYENSTTTA